MSFYCSVPEDSDALKVEKTLKNDRFCIKSIKIRFMVFGWYGSFGFVFPETTCRMKYSFLDIL